MDDALVLRDEIAQALHAAMCGCPPSPRDCPAGDWDDWRTRAEDHVLPIFQQREKALRAQALRDAADAWQRGAWADAPRRPDRGQERIANGQYVCDWLRARAEQQ